MKDIDITDMARILSDVYTQTYESKMAGWGDTEYEDSTYKKENPMFEKLLREVMIELHRSGQDTFIALKNDKLRDWWSVELAKIKKEEAKVAAREKAKSLLSEEERKLLGMRF